MRSARNKQLPSVQPVAPVRDDLWRKCGCWTFSRSLESVYPWAVCTVKATLRCLTSKELFATGEPLLAVTSPQAKLCLHQLTLPRRGDSSRCGHIIEALKAAAGKISGQGGAAERLRLRRTTLQSKMRKLGIAPLPRDARLYITIQQRGNASGRWSARLPTIASKFVPRTLLLVVRWGLTEAYIPPSRNRHFFLSMLPAAAEQRALNRAEFIPSEFHCISPEWRSRPCAVLCPIRGSTSRLVIPMM